MLGSEGTLGIITRVTLASGVVPCAVELLEHGVPACVEHHLNRRWPAARGYQTRRTSCDRRRGFPRP